MDMRVIVVVLVIIKSSASAPLNVNLTCHSQTVVDNVQVFITVSSLAVSTTPKGIVKRQLEVNWAGKKSETGESVGIYDVDPKKDPARSPIFSVDPSAHNVGFIRTRVELPLIFFNLSCLNQDPCLGYWAAYKNKQGKLLASSCLQTRPFWMEHNAQYLSSQTLYEIMIPGSHDSGSFYYRKERILLAKYKYTQDEPIFNQLVYGLRYFDFRVGYYRKKVEKFFINHNFLRTDHSVSSVLDQVLEFVNATKEIVILDFHNFPIGFHSNDTHRKLMDLIIKKFGALLIPHTQTYANATLRYLWQHNKRILVSYNNNIRKVRSPSLWPGILRAWGNKQHPDDLRSYFQEVFSGPLPKGLWASMAELTPSARTIVLHPESGLRLFADEVNRNVTHWFRDLFWQKANIVATDYFLGNNLIDVAIETNRVKIRCPRNPPSKASNKIS